MPIWIAVALAESFPPMSPGFRVGREVATQVVGRAGLAVAEPVDTREWGATVAGLTTMAHLDLVVVAAAEMGIILAAGAVVSAYLDKVPVERVPQAAARLRLIRVTMGVCSMETLLSEAGVVAAVLA